MRQAFLEHKFDFRNADFFDRWWWRRLNWVLEGLEAENGNRIESLRQNLHAGALTYGVSQEAFDCHWEQAQELNRRVYNRLFPWARQAQQSARKNLAQAWRNVWGDENDPDVKKKIDATVEYLMGMARSNQKQGGNHAAQAPRQGIRRGRKGMGPSQP